MGVGGWPVAMNNLKQQCCPTHAHPSPLLGTRRGDAELEVSSQGWSSNVGGQRGTIMCTQFHVSLPQRFMPYFARPVAREMF